MLNYTIVDALAYLKDRISVLEQRLKKERSSAARKTIENLIYWHFHQGIEIIKLAKEGEVSQEWIDFFLDRAQERPDIKKLRESWGKE